ncbi:MAG: Nif3-like dinuclear metal center hexameric protein [Rhodoferax sp.]
MQRTELLAWLDQEMQSDRFRDYAPNGLQVQGRAQVRKLVCGVTASRALIDAAVAQQADTVLVHHGLFWRGHDGRITGWLRERLAPLLAHDINLIAYHLPLDAHPQWGNNAQWGQRLGLVGQASFGEQQLGWLGQAAQGAFANAQALATHVQQVLGRAPLCVPGSDGPIERIAWCSGGAQGSFEAAIAAGAQAYLTGEISEPQAHLARECGVSFLACGHHASERYGIQALAAVLRQQHGLDARFIDIDNPA